MNTLFSVIWMTWMSQNADDAPEAAGSLMVAAIQGSILLDAVVGGLLLLKMALLGLTLVLNSWLVTRWGRPLDPMVPLYAVVGLGGLAGLVVYLRCLAPEALGIQRDNSSTRVRLIGTAAWTLRDLLADQALVANGTARSVDGYNVLNQQFFALELENEAATRRVTAALADQVTVQLASFFASRAAS